MLTASDGEGLASWILYEGGIDLDRRFDLIAAVTALGMRIERSDRTRLRRTCKTPSGYEIALARFLSYEEQQEEVAHELVERAFIERGLRPALYEDDEDEDRARAQVELAAETVTLATVCPYRITNRMWWRHCWDLPAYRKELYVREATVALRLGNLRHVPVALVRRGRVTRSDWWTEPVYDHEIIAQARDGYRERIDLTDEDAYVIRWW